MTGRLHAEQLEGFVRTYSLSLTRYFKKRCGVDAVVEDLVQEVFVRLAARDSADAIENPEAYLMTTASSVWRDYLRRKKVRAAEDHVEYQENEHAVEVSSAERVYEGKEQIQQVVRILNELPARTRAVFVLCRLEGLKQKDVARRLGVSVSSVEKHMIKAVAHLADRLERE